MNFLIKRRKSIATTLLTIIYCQTVLAAYQPWADESRNYIQHYALTPVYNPKKIISSSPFRENPVKPINTTIEKKEVTVSEKNEEDSREEIGGPTQPEMSSFKSVNSDNMVDLFSGDFSYNIPLLDVGGYPINLFYKSGITMDQEASWVGLGWNINPGTITRNLRGIPDDFDGNNDVIQKSNAVAMNKTIGGDFGGDMEFFGLPVNVGISLGAFYNTYRGWGMQSGIHASISSGSASMGTLSAGLSLVNNSQEGITLSPISFGKSFG